jgi:hypothetical protein
MLVLIQSLREQTLTCLGIPALEEYEKKLAKALQSCPCKDLWQPNPQRQKKSG